MKCIFEGMKNDGPILLRPVDINPVELAKLSKALEDLGGNGVVQSFLNLVDGLRAGKSFTVVDRDEMLTPAQAAEILDVSRSYVSRLIRSGRLAAHKVGSHHRIPMKSVLEKLDREASLSEISALGKSSQSHLD